MQNGEIDFVVGLLKRPDREAFIHYVHPPYKTRSDTVFFLERGREKSIRTYEDLYPLRIGTTLGSKYFPRFDNDSRLTKEPVPNSVSSFKKLLAGRVDTVVFPESAGIDMVHRMGLEKRMVIADFRFTRKKEVFIGISRKSALMKAIAGVEDTIRSMIENGEIKKIIVDYYSSRGLPVPALQL